MFTTTNYMQRVMRDDKYCITWFLIRGGCLNRWCMKGTHSFTRIYTRWNLTYFCLVWLTSTV